jgi:23S rRNA (pseudouridine1915-N3)-methyltransferase
MRITILAQGRKLDRETAALCDEYVRRSRPLVPFELVVCNTAKAQWERAKALAGPIVVLDERGQAWSSPELAERIGRWRDAGTRHLACLIGGADGFDDAERARADAVFSLSRLTLPHRLAQLVVCEQLYRAGTILAGHPYHHA